MDLEIKYSMHIDLIFHVLAYLKIENASNCYCQEYIDKMSIEKNSFEYNIVAAIDNLKEYYNKNFGRLMLINFLPFYSSNYDELKQIFLENNNFTAEDKQCFLLPFIEALDRESKFYFPYWHKKYNSCIKTRVDIERRLENEFDKYECLFAHFNKHPQLYLSFSITQNGRGIYSNLCFSAIVPYPNSLEDFNNTFFTALNEYTHGFTDNLLNNNISMSDDTHNISEFVVILADYYIVKTIESSTVSRYFKWLSEKSGNASKAITVNEFFNTFKIENNLEEELKKTLNSISDVFAL